MVRVSVHGTYAVSALSGYGGTRVVDGKAHARSISAAVESFSHQDARFVQPSEYDGGDSTNPLIQAVHLAFANHYGLVLSPDTVFNVILQGVSEHVGKDPERHRQAFVSHAGKQHLVTVNNDLVRGGWSAGWEDSIVDLGQQVAARVSGTAAAVLGTRFTTTGPAQAAAHAAAFMDVVKHYFEYTVMTMCGIPWVEVLGTEQDWRRLGEVVPPLLDAVGLGWWWTDHLRAIVDQCAAAFRGPSHVDGGHWARIYKHHEPHMSGGVAEVSGWIGKLFLYIDGGVVNPLLGANGDAVTVRPSKFPRGLTRTPFIWEYLATDKLNMTLQAGLVGVVVDEATGALRPEVGWLVAHTDRA